jgi:hypothetical protein
VTYEKISMSGGLPRSYVQRPTVRCMQSPPPRRGHSLNKSTTAQAMISHVEITIRRAGFDAWIGFIQCLDGRLNGLRPGDVGGTMPQPRAMTGKARYNDEHYTPVYSDFTMSTSLDICTRRLYIST